MSVRRSVCAAGSASGTCQVEAATLTPSLVGGNGCDAFAKAGVVCYRQCWEDVYARLTASPADPAQVYTATPHEVLWAPEALQLAAAIGGIEDGCLEWGGLPPGAPKQVLALGLDGYMPTTWWQATGARDSVPAHFVFMSEAILSAVSGILSLPFDARVAPWASIETCQTPDAGFRAVPSEPCVGRGVEGLQLQAESSGSGSGPYYVDPGGAIQPQAPDQFSTSTSIAAFGNVALGDLVVHILPPMTGGSVHCTADPYGDGWSWGDTPTPDTCDCQCGLDSTRTRSHSAR